jgi:hypothetical protein
MNADYVLIQNEALAVLEESFALNVEEDAA